MDGDIWEAACCLFRSLPGDDGSASPDQDNFLRSVVEKMRTSSVGMHTILDGTVPSEQHNVVKKMYQAELLALRSLVRNSASVAPTVESKGSPLRLPAIISDHEVLVDIQGSREREVEMKQVKLGSITHVPSSAAADRMTDRCDLVSSYFCTHPVRELAEKHLPLLSGLPKNLLGNNVKDFCLGIEEILRQVSSDVFIRATEGSSNLPSARCVELRSEYLKSKEKLTLIQQRRLDDVRLEAEVFVKEHQKKAYNDLLRHKLSWDALVHTPAAENKWPEMEQALKQHCQNEFDHRLHQLGRLQEKSIADVMVSRIEALTMGVEVLAPVRLQLLFWEAFLRAETFSLQHLVHAVSTAEKDISKEMRRFCAAMAPVKASANTASLQQGYDCAGELASAFSESKSDVLKSLSAIRRECLDEIRLASNLVDLEQLLGVVGSFQSGESCETHGKLRKQLEATLTRWNYVRSRLGRQEDGSPSLRAVIPQSEGNETYIDSLNGSS